MDFNDNARLDTSQVEVNPGGGRGRGGVAAGGGLVAIVGVIATLLFGFNPFESQQSAVQQGNQQPVGPTGDLGASCQTGMDADQNEQCRIVGVVNSIQAYWQQVFANNNRQYSLAKTQLFTNGTQTACGYATAQVGPFYCPGDRKVYLDLSFFRTLQQQFGAKGGPFAQAYVIGHEYGHHVQNLLGTMSKVRQGTSGASSAAVRLELQADCYAGAWMKNAVQTGYLTQVTPEDLAEALSAAQAVGDDSIQSRTQGYVQPDAFTHGTSAQRTKWVNVGYDSGDPNRCTTFSGAI